MNDIVTRGELGGWIQPRYQLELKKIIKEERSALRSGERRLNKHHRGLPEGKQ